MRVIGAVGAAALAAGVVTGLLVLAWPRAKRGEGHAAKRPARFLLRHAGLRRWVEARMDPGTATGLALTAALAVVSGGLVAVGAVLAMVVSSTGLARLDDAAWTGRPRGGRCRDLGVAGRPAHRRAGLGDPRVLPPR